jgi:hypothetical protein
MSLHEIEKTNASVMADVAFKLVQRILVLAVLFYGAHTLMSVSPAAAGALLLTAATLSAALSWWIGQYIGVFVQSRSGLPPQTTLAQTPRLVSVLIMVLACSIGLAIALNALIIIEAVRPRP